MGIIYRAYCKISQKGYTGITKRNFDTRQQEHIEAALNHSDDYHFHKAIRKYGIENFEWQIIGEFDNNSLSYLETYFIFIFGDYGYGYNMTPGGEGRSREVTEEEKEKQKEAKRHKMIKIYCIELDMFFESINEAARFTGIPDGNIAQCIRDDCDRTTAGGYHWCLADNIKTIEEIEANRKKHIYKKDAVYCVELNMFFDSISDASKYTGIARGNISKVVRGERKTAGGYHFMYAHNFQQEMTD